MRAGWPRTPRARGITGRIRSRAADFRVIEHLGVEPTDAGAHLLLEVEKTDLNTQDAALALAAAYGVAVAEVGYAGMKDKRSVARQWFSLPVAESAPLPAALPPGLCIRSTRRHARKLRRGELAGNGFVIVIREVSDPARLVELLPRLADAGAPNYFGAQRFGRDNLERARAWLAARRQRRVSRFAQGLYLSVLRSFLFNEVLAARVAAGSWRELVPGDVAQDGLPTGPLWGRGRSTSAGTALAIETAALAPHAGIREGLEHAGVRQDRRPLVLVPRALSFEVQDDRTLSVAFELPPGGYATSLLGDLVDLSEARPECAT